MSLIIKRLKNGASSTYNTTVPLKGEVCIYSDLRKVKIGDGTNTITDLSFATLTPEEVQSLIEAASHSHSNKDILDSTTASFTTALLTKLNGIATGAEVNQNAFSKITVGSTTVEADSATDTLTLVAGSNVTITPDATNDKITISSVDTKYTHPNYTTYSSALYKIAVDDEGHVSTASAVSKSDITSLGIPGTDTKYNVATSTSNGLMSADDKKKLDKLRDVNSGNSLPSSGSEGDIFFLRI